MVKQIVYPECPSPKSKEDYEVLVESMFARITSEEHSLEWKSFNFVDNGEQGIKDVKLYDRQSTDCPMDAMKVTGTIPASVDYLMDLFWDIEKRNLYEKDLVEATVIEKISDSIEVVKTRYSAPFPVTNRQFIMLRAKLVKDGVAYIVALSINHPACVEEKDYVLAVSKLNITIIRPGNQPGQASLTRISQMDPKGSVPKFATNFSKSKLGEFMITLRHVAIAQA